MSDKIVKAPADKIRSELKLQAEIEKAKKKKKRLPRLIIIAFALILLGIFIPQIAMGATGIALVKEVMSGEYETMNKILDKILGINKKK